MFLINEILRLPSIFGIISNPENGEVDEENSTLLKIASCIPGIGLVINKIESSSLNKKLEQLSLPKKLRPHPMMGNILNENATREEIKTACERALQLGTIQKDYTKTALINNILTIALAVYALAINIIPFFIGAFIIGGFSLTAAIFTFCLCTEDYTELYKDVAAGKK